MEITEIVNFIITNAEAITAIATTLTAIAAVVSIVIIVNLELRKPRLFHYGFVRQERGTPPLTNYSLNVYVKGWRRLLDAGETAKGCKGTIEYADGAKDILDWYMEGNSVIDILPTRNKLLYLFHQEKDMSKVSIGPNSRGNLGPMKLDVNEFVEILINSENAGYS